MKDRAGRDRELFFAAFAFPDRAGFQVVVLWAAALWAAALWADRLAIRLSLADRAEGILSGLVRHTEDFDQ